MPKFLWYFVKSQKKYIIIFALVSAMFTFSMLIDSYYLSKLLGELPQSLKHNQWEQFIFYLWILIFLKFIVLAIGLIHTIVYTKFRGYLNIFVRIFGVDKMIEMDYSKLAKLGSGKLLQIVKNGVDAYSYLIYDGLDRILEILIRVIFLIIFLSFFNIWFLVAFIIGFAFIFLVQKFVFKKLEVVRERERELNENYTKQTAKIFMNFILLKIAHLKEKELQKLFEIGKQRVNNYIWLKFWFGAGARLTNFMISLFFLVVLYYFGKLYLAGEVNFDIILFVSLLFMYASRTLYRLTFFITELAEKWTYIQRYDEILAESNNVASDKLLKIKDFRNYDINYNHIWFKYEGQKLYLFEDFNLKVPKGQKVAILGRSGSGKSTLFKLLVRLVEPEKGNIFFENKEGKIDIRNIDPVSIYKKIGYFYQEPLVFDGTIRENLTLGIKQVDDNKLREVLKIVELDHLNLDDVIGERGVLLSGGEKQRLALARAFIFDYDILLLDEPTSNLDLYLEKKILEEIFRKYDGRTVLVISHRPYVLEEVDRIIVMKKGEIIFDKEKKDNIDIDKVIELFVS